MKGKNRQEFWVKSKKTFIPCMVQYALDSFKPGYFLQIKICRLSGLL